ncbi:MAG: DUF805 domain-containing protein [Muribaculum sp.]|nr:DUF805 domain-containing protein [Muribaculaceae bacterium]MCM1080746.1 DUF805 domain-containing protein [Muribaculum sp.]
MNQTKVTFFSAIKSAFTVNYCNFRGRATRPEYFYLLYIYVIVISSFVLTLVEVGKGASELVVNGMSVFTVLMLSPMLSLTARRFHDIGHSGWWSILYFIPFVGWLVVPLWLTKKSQPANEYGPGIF